MMADKFKKYRSDHRVDIRIVKTGKEHYLFADEIRESSVSAIFNLRFLGLGQ